MEDRGYRKQLEQSLGIEPQICPSSDSWLGSPIEDKKADHRHGGMDGRHPGPKDASGDFHVNLDSSTPCWNDAIEESLRGETVFR